MLEELETLNYKYKKQIERLLITNDKLQTRMDEAIKRCDYLLKNDKVIINGKEYIKQPDDDYITIYVKEALVKNREEDFKYEY